MEIGETFLFPSGPEDYLHLSIICSKKRKLPDMRLFVSISTLKPDKFHDPTCIIEAGEHEFVKHRSFVAYSHAQQRSSNKINLCIKNGQFIKKPNLNDGLLERVLKGFRTSDFAPPWCLGFLE
jgi:hypothetical protein